MGFFLWIIFGALAGWAANVVIGKGEVGNGCLFSVIVGVVGSVLGGLIYRLITGNEKRLILTFRALASRCWAR